MNLKLLIGLALLASLGTAHADSLPELQSRCGNNAAVFFAWQSQQDHEARKPNTRSIVYDYKNQYSESMKGCFIVITTHAEWDEGKYSGSYKADLHRSTTYMVFDVNAERLLGTYFKERPLTDGNHDSCDFGGVKCSSEAEWRAKVEPYVSGWKG